MKKLLSFFFLFLIMNIQKNAHANQAAYPMLFAGLATLGYEVHTTINKLKKEEMKDKNMPSLLNLTSSDSQITSYQKKIKKLFKIYSKRLTTKYAFVPLIIGCTLTIGGSFQIITQNNNVLTQTSDPIAHKTSDKYKTPSDDKEERKKEDSISVVSTPPPPPPGENPPELKPKTSAFLSRKTSIKKDAPAEKEEKVNTKKDKKSHHHILNNAIKFPSLKKKTKEEIEADKRKRDEKMKEREKDQPKKTNTILTLLSSKPFLKRMQSTQDKENDADENDEESWDE